MTASSVQKPYDTCGAKTRSGGKCRRPAGWGTDHAGAGCCKLHFGSTPAHHVRAERIMLDQRIGDLLEEYRRDREAPDPLTELLGIISLSAGMVWIYRQIVGELTAGAGGLWARDSRGDQRPHEAVRGLGEWSDRHARNCKLAIDAGIEERRVRLAEGTAEVIAGVLRAMAAGVLEVLGRAGGDPVLVRAVEGELPSVMRAALEGARVVDVSSEETA